MNKIEEIKTQIGNISPEQIVKVSTKVPGTKINRESFLIKELTGKYTEEIISDAVKNNPAHAGITKSEIEKIALKTISYETNKVSLISFAAGLPGGPAMAATIPADIAQYFAFVVRIMQKLAYLYGFPDFDFNEENISDSTMNEILTFLGIMFGVQEASAALKILSEGVVKSINRNLARKAIMSTTWYPALRRISNQIGIRMTRTLLTKSISKIGTIIGGFACGSLTYVSFRSCSNKLKSTLSELNLCDPNTYNN